MYMCDLILTHIYLLGFVLFKPGVTVWNRASALPLASREEPMQVIAFRTTKEPMQVIAFRTTKETMQVIAFR